MANTITISVSSQDFAELNDSDNSPTKLFRSAMALYRSKDEFIDIYDIIDYRRALRDAHEKFRVFQKEIERRQEIIDSLRDVLATKELNEQRRVREASKKNDGSGTVLDKNEN